MDIGKKNTYFFGGSWRSFQTSSFDGGIWMLVSWVGILETRKHGSMFGCPSKKAVKYGNPAFLLETAS